MSRIIQLGTNDIYVDLDNICTLKVEKYSDYGNLYINGVKILLSDVRDIDNLLTHWQNKNLIVKEQANNENGR